MPPPWTLQTSLQTEVTEATDTTARLATEQRALVSDRASAVSHLNQVALWWEAEAVDSVGSAVRPLAKLLRCLGERHVGGDGAVYNGLLGTSCTWQNVIIKCTHEQLIQAKESLELKKRNHCQLKVSMLAFLELYAVGNYSIRLSKTWSKWSGVAVRRPKEWHEPTTAGGVRGSVEWPTIMGQKPCVPSNVLWPLLCKCTWTNRGKHMDTEFKEWFCEEVHGYLSLYMWSLKQYKNNKICKFGICTSSRVSKAGSF